MLIVFWRKRNPDLSHANENRIRHTVSEALPRRMDSWKELVNLEMEILPLPLTIEFIKHEVTDSIPVEDGLTCLELAGLCSTAL